MKCLKCHEFFSPIDIIEIKPNELPICDACLVIESLYLISCEKEYAVIEANSMESAISIFISNNLTEPLKLSVQKITT